MKSPSSPIRYLEKLSDMMSESLIFLIDPPSRTISTLLFAFLFCLGSMEYIYAAREEFIIPREHSCNRGADIVIW